VFGSNFKRKPKTWPAFTQHESWGNLKIEYAPIFKLLVCFQEPLQSDYVVDGVVSLPAAQRPQVAKGVYALAINRYNKVVLSDDYAALQLVHAKFASHLEVLVGDASSAISSAKISGDYATELLSHGVDVDLPSLADGAYVRCQLDQAIIMIHRAGNTYCVHWPEPLTDYVVRWIGSVIALKRD
jgi:sarcosine oxidase gamma subunit